jgi:hypothetical protein
MCQFHVVDATNLWQNRDHEFVRIYFFFGRFEVLLLPHFFPGRAFDFSLRIRRGAVLLVPWSFSCCSCWLLLPTTEDEELDNGLYAIFG